MFNFDFFKRVSDKFLNQILRLIFQEKHSLCYILLTDQILLHDPHYFYFIKYWAVYVL